MNSELIAILLVLVATVAAVFLIFALVRSVFDAGRARRLRILGSSEEVNLLAPPEPPPAKSLPQQIDRDFERLVTETGWPITTTQVLGAMALCATVLAAIPILIREDYFLAALGVLAGMLLPLAVLALRRIQYRWKVQDEMPDAFFLLARSLRAGLNMEQSMATVATYGAQPLSGEFKRAGDQVELGLSVPAALGIMARRLNVTDFNILVTAVTLHRTVGGNLAQLLERVATAARDRSQFRGYFRAATALARITGFAIAIAPLLLLIGYAIWQPDFIERFTSSPTGLRMLIFAAVLEVVGAIWMFSLLRTDY